VYAVRDALAAVVRDRKDALILDFFAGSGTTLHATCLLNHFDGGRRRCILVTNNEVDARTARRLYSAGHFRGDEEYERHGIFEQATRPRCEAVITGRRLDGQSLGTARYIDGPSMEEGFQENVEFFDLAFLDPDEIEVGWRLNAILPTLWLQSGAWGQRDEQVSEDGMIISREGKMAVLLDESKARAFSERLEEHPAITHAYFVTDSRDAFSELRGMVRPSIKLTMLYRDYLRAFAPDA
jgi:adenine-specific DNA-methyltransferase